MMTSVIENQEFQVPLLTDSKSGKKETENTTSANAQIKFEEEE